ncbi:hypothetical protein [Streptomyces sp. NPDC057494]|uniref:nSTAND1 domain-containing NTPase n=1 Tax=Streptomyces sp. NPDC057494 TaxID=3346148 RepID=UPI00367455C8
MPQERGSFVGRKHELAELSARLEQNRLVTLVGAGGVGKSRLAARTASLLPPEAFESVQWAPLWSLGSGTLLIPLVADACGLSDHSARDPLDALATWLGARRVLLVLDSCEHLVQARARGTPGEHGAAGASPCAAHHDRVESRAVRAA